MQTLFQANIFFIITSITVVVLSLVALIALVYVILILNELRKLMRRIREEGENIVGDVSIIRKAIEHQGWKTKELTDALGRGFLWVLHSLVGGTKQK